MSASSTPSPTVVSLGCRLNAAEGEVMRAHAAAAGVGDSVIVNTCAVTGEAVRQSMQTIRRLRRENPSAMIVATGCAVQIDPDRFAAMPEVDHVVGNAEKMQPARFLALAGGRSPRVAVGDIQRTPLPASRPARSPAARVRAFLEIQNGCDHRCTFCVIPLGRGPSRSVPAPVVVEEVARLVEEGAGEVVLTGVDITAYGLDLADKPTLGRLVRTILAAVPALPRLRLSSIDSVEADAELLRAFAEEPRLMPHLHLSLQSGDDMILKRMKRRHSRADAIAFCTQVRRLRPDVVFGADLIAGFPTETDAMFGASLDIVEDCGLTWLHVFPYSPREGTSAARMPQVHRSLVRERAARLRAAGSARRSAWLDAALHTTQQVLMEHGGRGRTPGFADVEIAGIAAGSIVPVHVTGRRGDRLVGVLAKAARSREQ